MKRQCRRKQGGQRTWRWGTGSQEAGNTQGTPRKDYPGRSESRELELKTAITDR